MHAVITIPKDKLKEIVAKALGPVGGINATAADVTINDDFSATVRLGRAPATTMGKIAADIRAGTFPRKSGEAF